MDDDGLLGPRKERIVAEASSHRGAQLRFIGANDPTRGSTVDQSTGRRRLEACRAEEYANKKKDAPPSDPGPPHEGTLHLQSAIEIDEVAEQMNGPTDASFYRHDLHPIREPGAWEPRRRLCEPREPM